MRHLILYIGDDKGQVDGFLRELTFAKRLHERLEVRLRELEELQRLEVLHQPEPNEFSNQWSVVL